MAEQQPSKWGEILSIWNLRTSLVTTFMSVLRNS